MWDWLAQNRQWVFSGIGVVVLGWIFRKLASRQEPLSSNAHTTTQNPLNAVTQSPTININVPHAEVLQRPSQEPPVTPRPSVARANLTIEATKVGKVYLQEGEFTLSPDPHRGPSKVFRGLFVDVANVPTGTGKIKSVTVRAALKIQERSYSPLPWLDRYTNTITLEPAARKTLLLAAGEEKELAGWYFVLNHRDKYREIPMDWSNMAPIPSDLSMQILLVDVSSGESVGEFDYLWTYDANLGWPILKTPPQRRQSSTVATRETASKYLRQTHDEGMALRWKIIDSDDSLSVESCRREYERWREQLRSCIRDYASENKALYADSVPTVPQQSYSRMTRCNVTKAAKAGIVGHLDARLGRLLEIVKEL